MPDVDLTSVFRYVGVLMVRDLRTNISERQAGIDGEPFTIIRPSTARARALILGAGVRGPGRHQGPFFNRNINLAGRLRKSPARAVPVTRLLFTGRFAKGAFKYDARPDMLRVYVSRGNYPVHWTQQPVSYSDIVAFNNQGSPAVNRNIANPPLIFPNRGNQSQVEMMRSYGAAKKWLSSRAVNQYITDRIARAAFRKVSITVVV